MFIPRKILRSGLAALLLTTVFGVVPTALAAPLAPAAYGEVRDNDDDGTPDLVTPDFFAVLNTSTLQERAIAEFGLPGLTGPLVSATFQSGPIGQNSLAGNAIDLEFYGYADADGLLSSSDYGAGSVLIASFSNSGTPFSVDVTDFINSRLLAGDAFVGFELRDLTESVGRREWQNPTLDVSPTAPVPLPAALPLLGFGLAALAGLRRRR